ncbi:hypothetical protein [Pantoea agglomerans]|uniref:hypothetical protein n=2 Tax=Enterobacter agglomerans TaxID=549 RepID=UPI000E069FD0|nr:Pullulanase secretion envelope pulD [Pantoea agglomerans]
MKITISLDCLLNLTVTSYLDNTVMENLSPVDMGNWQLVLTIDSKADSLSNDNNTSDITTNQRQIQTTVEIKDGQTLLLGGPTDTNSTDSNRSISWFENIPVIGWLFRSHSDSVTDRTMFVLLTTDVIREL